MSEIEKNYAKRVLSNVDNQQKALADKFDKKFKKSAKLGNSRKCQMSTVEAYKCIFQDRLNKYVIVNGGRVSGKSKQIYMECIFYILSHTYRDVLVCRANDNSIQNSCYNELMTVIYDLGLEYMFEFHSKPLEIIKTDGTGKIYFMGVSGNDTSRTRSFHSMHSIGVVVFEELQQVRGQENLEMALASFRRLLDINDWRIFLVFNPPAQNAHWVNVWANVKKADSDYIVLHTSYLDILPYVNDIDLKEILKCKLFEYEKYRNYYMGEATGGFGSIYPMFKPETHVISEEVMRNKFSNLKIVGMIIGVDSAVSHDATCFCPMMIFENGQSVILNIFYHDPKTSKVLSSNEIVELAKNTWWKALCRKYNLYDSRSDKYTIPIIFKVDSAAADMIRELMYNFNTYDGMISVEKYSKPSVLEMISMVGSVLSRHSVYIVDFGGYKDWVRDKFIVGGNPIAIQLESLIWNEKQTGYDPIVPNDASDSFTYAVCTYYKNPDNLYWLNTIDRSGYYDINKNNL